MLNMVTPSYPIHCELHRGTNIYFYFEVSRSGSLVPLRNGGNAFNQRLPLQVNSN